MRNARHNTNKDNLEMPRNSFFGVVKISDDITNCLTIKEDYLLFMPNIFYTASVFVYSPAQPKFPRYTI